MAGQAGAIRAGRAFVELFADDSPLRKGLAGASAKLKAWGASTSAAGGALFGIGSAIVGSLFGASKVFADMGSELLDTSNRTGIAVEELSALKFAAEQGGASFEDLQKGIAFMQRKGLGQSAADFQRIAAEIQAMPEGMERTQAAVKNFGKGGIKLLSIFGDLGEKMQEAKDLGLIFSTEDAEGADALGDALDALAAQGKFLVATIGSAVGPIFVDLAKQMMPVIKAGIDWVKEHKPLVVLLLKVGAAVAAVGVGLMVLGPIISTAGMLLGALPVIVGAIFSPIGLIVGAVAGLATAFFTLTETGQTAWAGIADAATTAWGGIVDALMTGDLGLAAEIAWQGIKTAFLNGTATIQTWWIDFTSTLKKAWTDLTFVLADSMLEAFRRIQIAWMEFKAMFATGINVEAERLRINLDNARQRVSLAQGNTADQTALDADRQSRLDSVGIEAANAQEALSILNAQAAARRGAMNARMSAAARNRVGEPGLDGIGGKSETSGTFIGAAAGQLGSGGLGEKLDKQIALLEKIEEGQRKQTDALTENGTLDE